MNSIKIQIPSLVENIRIVESFIDNAKERFDINDDIYGNIVIAVIESVNNAIVHGNQLDKKKNVDLVLTVDDNTLKFTIVDQGIGFDYNNLADPTKEENLYKEGGRGIYIMKSLCDEVEFEEEGKVVNLSFYIP